MYSGLHNTPGSACVHISRFNTVLFLFCVLIRGVLLPGGGPGVRTATGVPSEYISLSYKV